MWKRKGKETTEYFLWPEEIKYLDEKAKKEKEPGGYAAFFEPVDVNTGLSVGTKQARLVTLSNDNGAHQELQQKLEEAIIGGGFPIENKQSVIYQRTA